MFWRMWVLALSLVWVTQSYPSDSVSNNTSAVTGTLNLYEEDYFSQDYARRAYTITDHNGQIFILQNLTDAQSAKMYSGDQVVVQNPTIRSKSPSLTPTLQATNVQVTSHADSVPTAYPYYTDARRSLILVLDFVDSPVSCSDESLLENMFLSDPSVAQLYWNMSGGEVAFPDDTNSDQYPDIYRVAINAATSDPCDPFAWAAMGNSAASAAGVDLSLYQHFVYVLPSRGSCGWAGLGQIGCPTTCSNWIATCQFPDVFAHEIGHNLGFGHASTDFNNDGMIDLEYGDRSDFMGYGGVGWRGLNGAHEAQSNWFRGTWVTDANPWGIEGHLLTPLQEGRFGSIHPQVLKFTKLSSPGTSYYVSYRQAQSYDSDLLPEFVDRVAIHTYRENQGYQRTLLVRTLGDGDIFEDPENQITIRMVSHDSSTASVEISGWIDVTPPDALTGLSAKIMGNQTVILSWNPSYDSRSGLAGYRIIRDDQLIGTTTDTTYTDLTAGFKQQHLYRVEPFDKNGNIGGGPAIGVITHGPCAKGRGKNCMTFKATSEPQ